ncbi:MAG: hypothetical protein JST83_12530 [Bacteroidetes bacterium]|nr:hypothetical protein [Bacteroidota bacterium]
MKDYIQFIKNEKEGSVSVRFDIKSDKIAALGDKIKAVNGGVAMNGSGWEALLEWYLDEFYPGVSGGMGSNSVAGMYKAYYKLTPANEKKAEQLAEVLSDMVENDSKLIDLLKERGEEIDWD